jgi:microcin C transport system permease protein
MLAASDSLFFCASSDTLHQFFAALERRRIECGVDASVFRVDPRRRADVIELLLALNLERGWGAPNQLQSEADLLERKLSPILSESSEARRALQRALKDAPPGRFNEAVIGGKSVDPVPRPIPPPPRPTPPLLPKTRSVFSRGSLRAVLVTLAAAAAISLSILAVLTLIPSIKCLIWSASDCEATQSRSEARDIRRLYGAALLEATRALRDHKYQLTPRQLAHDFAATRGGSATEKQLIASMLAGSPPGDADRLLPGTVEGAAALRRYAAILASTQNQLDPSATLQFADPSHDDDPGTVGGEPTVSATLEKFSGAPIAPEQPGLPPPQPSESSTTRWIVLCGLALALVGLVVRLWGVTRADAARLVSAGGDAIGTKVTLAAPAPTIIGAPRARLTQLAQDLARRQKTPRRQIDLIASVNASVTQLGFLTPRYKLRSALIETVFLLNRRGRNDQARDRIAQTVDALKSLGAPVTRYDYSHEPRFLFRGDDWGWDRAIPFMQVRDVHSEARIVVVSDGNEFVNRSTFRPLAWVGKMFDWPDVVLLGPSIRGVPGTAASSLKRALGWRSDEATLDGLARLSPRFPGEQEYGATRPPKPEFNVGRSLPASLAYADNRLKADLPLGEDEQAELVSDLRLYLGSAGFFWLAATAIYPELRHDLTVKLGLTLKDRLAPGLPPVFDDDRLARMVGLPWFRGGRYPNWVRRMLFHALDPEAQRHAQDAVANHIAAARIAAEGSTTEPGQSSFESGVAQAGITRFSIWRPDRRGDTIPLDAVTAELVRHGGRDDLMPLLTGRPVAEIFGDARRRAWLDRAPFYGPALALATAGLWAVPKPWSSRPALGDWLPMVVLVIAAAVFMMAAFFVPAIRARSKTVALGPRHSVLQLRLDTFRRNRGGAWSLCILLVLFVPSLFAEFIANDRPLIASYKGEILFPVFFDYPEDKFGGFQAHADFRDPFIADEIKAHGWMIWPPIRFANSTTFINAPTQLPVPPTWTLSDEVCRNALHNQNVKDASSVARPCNRLEPLWLGSDEDGHDVVARLLYGTRLSLVFGLTLAIVSFLVGVPVGAVLGWFDVLPYFVLQQVILIWSSLPRLYIVMILSAIFASSFVSLLSILLLFSWAAVTQAVRAEFLRARNLEYVRAARALGVSNTKIIVKHILPEAMGATMTVLPIIVISSISTLITLDFLGLGMPPDSPSLGELLLQGKMALSPSLFAPWIPLSAVAVTALLLLLLSFIAAALRDAFDPKKMFS